MFIYIILILGGVIHTEMVVINYCGLQENTKLFLESIESEDMQSIKEKKDENEISLNEYIIKNPEENDENNEEITNNDN